MITNDSKHHQKYIALAALNWKRHNIGRELVGTNNLVLDIGSGTGLQTYEFLKNGNEVVSLDISLANLMNIGRMVNDPKMKLIQADAYRLPFLDFSFDIVFSGELIEHLYDTDAFLAECYRVLKEQGRLVLTTPNVANLTSRLYLLFGGFNDNQNEPAHIRFFTFKSLKKILEKNNFKIESIYGDAFSIPFITNKIRNPKFLNFAKSVNVTDNYNESNPYIKYLGVKKPNLFHKSIFLARSTLDRLFPTFCQTIILSAKKGEKAV